MISDCVLAHQQRSTNGYVRIQVKGQKHQAHRYAWEQKHGPIPEGMVVDHLCHTEAVMRGECSGGYSCVHRACINLDHLRLVPQSDNILTGLHSVDNKDSCPRGHSYPESLWVRPSGKRECGECNRARARRKAA